MEDIARVVEFSRESTAPQKSPQEEKTKISTSGTSIKVTSVTRKITIPCHSTKYQRNFDTRHCLSDVFKQPFLHFPYIVHNRCRACIGLLQIQLTSPYQFGRDLPSIFPRHCPLQVVAFSLTRSYSGHSCHFDAAFQNRRRSKRSVTARVHIGSPSVGKGCKSSCGALSVSESRKLQSCATRKDYIGLTGFDAARFALRHKILDRHRLENAGVGYHAIHHFMPRSSITYAVRSVSAPAVTSYHYGEVA